MHASIINSRPVIIIGIHLNFFHLIYKIEIIISILYYKKMQQILNRICVRMSQTSKSAYVRLFNKAFFAVKFPPALTLTDIKYSLAYESGKRIPKPSIHNGQRKLFLSELQFLTQHNEGIAIYVGAAPGNKTGFLASLF